MSVDHVQQPWAIRSTLVAVTDLDRSAAFYRDVGLFEEVIRKGGVAILGHVALGSIFLILRERQGMHGVRHGQQSLGLRSIAFNVRSVGELDRIDAVLHDYGCFSSRRTMADGAPEMVRGRDPDNLPLVFVSDDENRTLSTEYYLAVADLVHSLDV
jgi:hypothetical protein